MPHCFQVKETKKASLFLLGSLVKKKGGRKKKKKKKESDFLLPTTSSFRLLSNLTFLFPFSFTPCLPCYYFSITSHPFVVKLQPQILSFCSTVITSNYGQPPGTKLNLLYQTQTSRDADDARERAQKVTVPKFMFTSTDNEADIAKENH